VSVSEQFTDALTAWQEAPPTALFCLVSGATQTQFVIAPSAAAAPADATCVTRGGAPVAPQPAPSSTAVTAPPVNGVPPSLGPVMPAPVQDIVIERPTPTLPSLIQRTPVPPTLAPVQRPAPTSTPVPTSAPRRPRPVPTPVLLDPEAAPRPSVPITGYAPTAATTRAHDRPAGGDTQPVTPDRGSADTTANFAAVPPPPEAQIAPGVRTLAGLRLGPAVADYFGNVVVTDPSVLVPGKLFMGGSFVPLQASDGTPVSTTDTPLSFTLSPEAAAPLAGSGRPGPFRVFAFNPDTGAFGELPTTLVLYDDGGVMVTVLPPVPPQDVAALAPVADPASGATPSDADLTNLEEPPADQPPADAALPPASEELTDVALPPTDPLADAADAP
jgi:hypothetical protein